jgi:hypothetical protein
VGLRDQVDLDALRAESLAAVAGTRAAHPGIAVATPARTVQDSRQALGRSKFTGDLEQALR